MLRNYFTVAWRNLIRNKTFSFLNLAGLAIGLCCFLLIALYVIRECSYDRYNHRAKDIYRVNQDVRWGGQDIYNSQSSDMLGPLLRKDYPQVEEYTRIYNQSSKKLVKRGTEYLTEEKVAYVDSTFFNMFTLPAIEGNAKILGYKDPPGQNLYIINNGQVTSFPIIGVVKDFNYESMHQPIGPLVLRLAKSPGLVSFKVAPEDAGQIIARAREIWKAILPE